MSWLKGLENMVRQTEPLAPHTWLQIGGPADFFAEPRTIEELKLIVTRCRDEGLPMRLLGGGSNVLVRDEGVRGVVIRLHDPAFAQIDVKGREVTAGGGARLGHVISSAISKGLAGLETLVGIPGTIGGALHGNAGGHAGDIGQWTARATVLTRSGEIIERERDDLVFAYRQSSLDELAILSATFRLDEDNPDELTKRMQKLWIVKKANQPLSHERSGCIFKSPRGMSAGMLIDQAGMKGSRAGSAAVSERHGNFITVDSGARSGDVLELIDQIRARVSERLGIELETEIEVW